MDNDDKRIKDGLNKAALGSAAAWGVGVTVGAPLLVIGGGCVLVYSLLGKALFGK